MSSPEASRPGTNNADCQAKRERPAHDGDGGGQRDRRAKAHQDGQVEHSAILPESGGRLGQDVETAELHGQHQQLEQKGIGNADDGEYQSDQRDRGQLAEEQLQAPDAAREQHPNRPAGILHPDQASRHHDRRHSTAEDLEHGRVSTDHPVYRNWTGLAPKRSLVLASNM